MMSSVKTPNVPTLNLKTLEGGTKTVSVVSEHESEESKDDIQQKEATKQSQKYTDLVKSVAKTDQLRKVMGNVYQKR